MIEDIEKVDPSINMVINVDDPYVSEAIIWRQSILDLILYKTIDERDIDKILRFIPKNDRYEIKAS